jgi:hypothetical protein
LSNSIRSLAHKSLHHSIKTSFFCPRFYVLHSKLLHLPPLRFHYGSEDAGIEPRAIATMSVTVRRSNHSARSYPQHGKISPTTQLYLIHSRLVLIHNKTTTITAPPPLPHFYDKDKSSLCCLDQLL